jgi:phosphoglycerate dehydrogenase-like enzyme
MATNDSGERKAGPSVWIPWDPTGLPELAGAGPALGVFDGGTEPGPAGDVEFFVLPVPWPAELGALLARMPRLRAVQTLTAGYENLLPLVPTGVTLANGRGVHDAPVAELAVGLAVAALRELPALVRAAGRAEWHEDWWAPGLAGKRVLILGYGSIGAAVERRLAGWDVTIERVARRARSGRPAAPGRPGVGQAAVHAVSELVRLLPAADVVIITAPLTGETEGLFDKDVLAAMPHGALLVNVGRGRIVDTGALVAELSSGRLLAALDVTDPEPLPADHPLWGLPNVLLSQHTGSASDAFDPAARRLVAEQVRRFLAGAPLANVVREG